MPVCPTWVKSDWFWIIKSDTTSSSAIMSPWKKWAFRQERLWKWTAQTRSNTDLQKWHTCCYTKLLLVRAINTHTWQNTWITRIWTTQHMTVRPWITTVSHRVLYLDLPEMRDRLMTDSKIPHVGRMPTTARTDILLRLHRNSIITFFE